MRRGEVRAAADRMFHAAAGVAPAHTLPTYRAIIGFRRTGHGAWPSQEWIARRVGLSVRQVKRHVRALLELDLLEVTPSLAHHDETTGQWRRRTNRYRCRWPRKTPGRTRRRPASSPRGHACPVKVPPVTPGTDPPPPDGVGAVSSGTPPPFKPGETGAQWAKRMMGRL